MKNEVIQGVSAADRYVHDYAVSGSGNKLDRVAGQLQEHRGSDKERKEKEKQSKAKLSEAAGILESINKLDQKVKQHNEEYQELQQYYDDSLTFNKEDAGSEYKGTDLDHDPYDAGKSAMKQTDSVYGSMAGMMSGIKDELFQNEYAALYFTHFDLGLLKDAAASPGSRLGDAVADEMSVSHQELEYIVYGFHNPVGNVSAAYAEIFAARLAVRTMEGLVKNSKLGNPLLVLAAALLYGVEMAMADMVKLCREGSVELSSYVKIQMTYRDYLRLFLLIHSDNEKKMSRMLALIRLNTGINPAERATYASGEVRIGMRLWFLPGVIQMAGYAGGSPDNVEGNRYYVTKKRILLIDRLHRMNWGRASAFAKAFPKREKRELGSIVLEASLVLPVFLFFVIFLIYIVQMTLISTALQSTVSDTVKLVSSHIYPVALAIQPEASAGTGDESKERDSGSWSVPELSLSDWASQYTGLFRLP